MLCAFASVPTCTCITIIYLLFLVILTINYNECMQYIQAVLLSSGWYVCCCKVIATVLHRHNYFLSCYYRTQHWPAGQVSHEVGGHTTNMNGVWRTQKEAKGIGHT